VYKETITIIAWKIILRHRLCSTRSGFYGAITNALRAMSSHNEIVQVTQNIHDNITWWLKFLPHFNGVSIIKPARWDLDDLHFTTDASLEGAGATCLTECFACRFPGHILSLTLHISALELFVVLVAVRVWASRLAGRRFIVSCDNESAVFAINSCKSRNPFMQSCLRHLWLLSCVHDFEIRAEHIFGQHNILAVFIVSSFSLKNFAIDINLLFVLFFCSLVLLCGDIELNPGPSDPSLLLGFLYS